MDKRYKIVRSSELEWLEKEVTALLNAGWTISGNFIKGSNDVYMQAMVFNP